MFEVEYACRQFHLSSHCMSQLSSDHTCVEKRPSLSLYLDRLVVIFSLVCQLSDIFSWQERPPEEEKPKLSKKKQKKLNRLSVAELKQVTMLSIAQLSARTLCILQYAQSETETAYCWLFSG